MVAELVIYKVERIAKDLEAFAGHAKRSTINSDDVKLVARNNPKLVRNEVSMFNNHKYKRNLERNKITLKQHINFAIFIQF